MQPHQPTTDARERSADQQCDERSTMVDSREMPCPVCGAAMPDLKGGKATICPVCGFKDSCCY
jgi:membrane protease subunit (stomatin/prohibitin family)